MNGRPRIYQLMVRHFGNVQQTRRENGSIEENGCGKFADINSAALTSLRELGITHVWLTGVLEQASATSYPWRPADDPLVVKGKAGSPYAIRDYFNVSPDYALDPEKRLDEFRDLLARCEAASLCVLIDLVPNHVARTHQSSVRPELSFGCNDNSSVFFARDNNYFYLDRLHPGGGPPLRLPDGMGGYRVFQPEWERGRVTGNNRLSWQPGQDDWYETVKLNYGHDFTTGCDTSHLPGPEAPETAVPDTWRKMDAIIGYWQGMGVGGFRADMAHMVPMEFWAWAIRRAHQRDPKVCFFAEAYDGDPAKLTQGDVISALVRSGFDAAYDGPLHQLLQQVYEGPKWANDIDALLLEADRLPTMLRYVENHDEVRVASSRRWGGWGSRVGKAASAVALGVGSGPVMIYSGQEVGEPALGVEGFSGDDGRSSIFDYGFLPEMQKWVNGHAYDGGGLDLWQVELRDWYGRLLKLCAQPALARGEFYGLNYANIKNERFGRVGSEPASGHWLHAFLRSERHRSQTFLVVVNLHPEVALDGVKVWIPAHALQWLDLGEGVVTLQDRLTSEWSTSLASGLLVEHGIDLPVLEPCSAMFLEWEIR